MNTAVFVSALLIIVLGYLTRKTGLLTRHDGGTIAKVVINVTLPALVIHTVPQIELTTELLFLPALALAHAATAFTVVTILFRRRTPQERGMITICSMGFNNGLFAFPIVMELWGIEAIKLLALFDVGNGLIVLGTNYVVAAYYGQGGHMELGRTIRTVVRTLCTSTPLIAFVGAMVLNLLGLALPAPVARAVEVVASANAALGLLVLGIFQSLSIRRSDLDIICKVLGLRYLVGIVFSLVTVLALGTSVLYRQVLGIAFVLPIGMTVIPFSVTFGLDARLATTMVNLTILVSFVLMWGVAAIL